jgi:hypothetical protein
LDKWKTVATSTTTPIGNTKRKEVLIKVPVIILGIHSNVGSSADFSDGHAWLSVSRDGVITNYGLWPDEHPRIIAMGLSDKKKSDIRVGMEDGQTSKAARYYKLKIKQVAILEEKLRENITWGYTNTCAAWASETVYAVTGEDVGADDTLGFETPRKLTESIEKLEKNRKTSADNPQGIPEDAYISTSSK